jgi:hypothetical protein
MTQDTIHIHRSTATSGTRSRRAAYSGMLCAMLLVSLLIACRPASQGFAQQQAQPDLLVSWPSVDEDGGTPYFPDESWRVEPYCPADTVLAPAAASAIFTSTVLRIRAPWPTPPVRGADSHGAIFGAP